VAQKKYQILQMKRTTMTTKPEEYPQWHNIVAGAVAGAGSRLATAPLDLVRIRWQLEKTVTYPRPSLWTTLKTIAENEGGVRALFRGSVAATYLWVGYSIVQFATYARVRAFLESEDNAENPHPTLVSFLSGATAGLTATAATYPFDICRTIFAARGVASQPLASSTGTTVPPPTSLYEFTFSVYHKRGIKAFYAGGSTAALQIIPYMGLNFAIYDRLTAGDKRVTSSGIAGSISGGISKIIVYPMDTIKKRLQAQAVFGSSGDRYDGLLDCFTKMLRREGFSAFYRGIVPSVAKTTIATSLTFSLYRGTKNFLENKHDA
jgi:solute carrier family 25 thiamine pyrophosphate transporter 19